MAEVGSTVLLLALPGRLGTTAPIMQTARQDIFRFQPSIWPVALLAITSCILVVSCILPAAASQDPDEIFAPFSVLLDEYVEEYPLEGGGLISSFDYRAALVSEKAAGLNNQQRRLLAQFDPDQIMQREQAIAFWINAYNFFMIAHILDNPKKGELIASVRDYGHLLNPYRVFNQDLFEIGGRKYSLSEIEIEILLGEEFAEKGWKDARVHFAVNCASVGCPPLRDHLYTSDNVDPLLDDNTRMALKTPLHLRIEDSTLWLTSLFDWYEDDFVEHSGSVRSFVDAHLDDETRQRIEQTERIRFIDYDWDLNSPENMGRVVSGER